MNKQAEILYGKEETFQSLRDTDALRTYSHHKALLGEQKKKLLDRKDWTEPKQQHVLNKLDKAIKFWDNMVRMVYGH